MYDIVVSLLTFGGKRRPEILKKYAGQAGNFEISGGSSSYEVRVFSNKVGVISLNETHYLGRFIIE